MISQKIFKIIIKSHLQRLWHLGTSDYIAVMRKIRLIHNPSELGAGTRGASMGPEALRVSEWNKGLRYLRDFQRREIEVLNEKIYETEETPNALRIKHISEMYERISTAVAESIKAKEFPFILSGDHSSGGATIAGLKIAEPYARLGVIWVDAHADLHTPYTSPSGNVHGMPLAASLGEDNIECKRNTPNESTVAYWEVLKNIGSINPKIKPEDIIFIALRDYEKEERALIERLNIKVITVEQYREMGAEKTMKECAEQLSDCDNIYISYDVDSIDSEISAGTGTPVPNGLTKHELRDLLKSLLGMDKVNCFEVTEINPCLDDVNKMADVVYDILEHAFLNRQ